MNYYLYNAPSSKERVKKKLHIGRSSSGYKFLFRGYDDIGSWQNWMNKIMSGDYLIKNEDLEVIYLKDFEKLIKSKQKGKNPKVDELKGWIDSEGYYFTPQEFS